MSENRPLPPLWFLHIIIIIIITGSATTPNVEQPNRHWNADSDQPNIPDPHGTKSNNSIPIKPLVVLIDWNYGYIPEAGYDKRVELRIKQPPTMGTGHRTRSEPFNFSQPACQNGVKCGWSLMHHIFRGLISPKIIFKQEEFFPRAWEFICKF